MPLQSGSAPAVVSNNIRELIASGHPHAQAVAIAFHNAHPEHRAMGGMTPRMPAITSHPAGLGPVRAPHTAIHVPSMLPRRDDGGSVGPTPGLQPSNANSSPVAQSYIQRFAQMSPEQLQEMVARLGNSPLAGIAQQVLKQKQVMQQAPSYAQTAQPTPLSPDGGQQTQPQAPIQQPTQQGGMQQAARGGETKPNTVPILAAGGEFVIEPSHVARWGDGDIKEGHRRLDKFVVEARKDIIKTMSKLRGPVKS